MAVTNALTEPTALVPRISASPAPLYSGKQMADAFAAYKELQVALDKAMPDAIMELDGKKFRKKQYWRGVAVAFNLTIETVEERRVVAGQFADGRDNFGYVITKRATAPNGRTVASDGTCFAVEKARRFKCPHPHPSWKGKTLHFPTSSCPDFDPEFQWRTLPGEATEHNVRGHASTRAFNRAVSDLVGFGEVSAEEVDRDDDHGYHAPPDATVLSGQGKPPARPTATPTGQPDAPEAVSSAQPAVPAAPGTTSVVSVQAKKGKSTRGEWTRYYVRFADGRDGVTFDKTIGEQLQAAAPGGSLAGALFNPEIRAGEKGNDLVGLLPIVPPEPVPAPDDPVDGPEKVLIVRKVETDKGPRWYIQTDKRQLVTLSQQHALEAVEAREAKRGIVPAFETVKSQTSGAVYHKLTGFSVADFPPVPDTQPEAELETYERESGEDG
jgi:hypothetical protein